MIFSILASAAMATAVPRDLTPLETAIIKKAIGEGLKDPESAQYQWYKWRGEPAYCGRINAKNSYGAYVGFRPFYVLLSNTDKSPNEWRVIVLGTGSTDDAPVSAQLCPKAGYDVSKAP